MEEMLLEKEEVCEDVFEGEPEEKPFFDSSYFGDFSVFLLLVRNDAFKSEIRSFDMQICGKSMAEWTENAFLNYPHEKYSIDSKTDVVSFVRPLLKNTKFTAVFFSDTPLLSRDLVEEIFMFARSRDINALKLKRGYVFNTEYIRNADGITESAEVSFGENDFFIVDSYEKFSKAVQIIKTNIINYHVSRGVVFEDVKTAYIDSDVEIEPGTIIKPNVVIRGQSIIGKNCVIGSFSEIENSIIGDGTTTKMCVIKECKTNTNSNILPFSYFERRII